MDTVLAVSTALCVVVWTLLGYSFLSWMFRWHSKKLPPGPREWGTSWKFLKASWNGTLPVVASEWARKYGDVSFVESFGQPILFLNSAEVSRELLAADEYKFLVADRIHLAVNRINKFNGKDLIFSKFDAILRKKRRLFHTMIRLYGDGVDKFENVVWGEMERLFTDIDKSEGVDIEITKLLVRSLIVILYVLAMGELPADPSVPDILEDSDLAFNKLSAADADFVLTYLPFVTYLPGKFKNFVNELLTAKEKADELMYYGPKRTYVPSQPRGMTDILMDHQKKPGYEWLEEDEEHILAILGSLFTAAHLTSRALLLGTFLCMLNDPKVTEKIREEIDRVIGDNRPKIEYKSLMPYTEATILEGVRIIAPVRLSGFRRASKDIEFKGMLIPKNTQIFMNNQFYLHDEKVWDDPWTFKPERFLDNEGRLLPIDHPRRKNLIAFGVGPRACPGEAFSRSRVFIIITGILQRYDILPPTSEMLPPADFQNREGLNPGIVPQTSPYKCRLIRRRKIK